MDPLLVEFEQDYNVFKEHHQAYLDDLQADDSDVLFRKYPRHAHYNAAQDTLHDTCDCLNRVRRNKMIRTPRAN